MTDVTLSAPRLLGGLTPSATARLLALLVPVGLLGGALFSQYVGGLWPCEMCWWQRYPHALAIPLAAAAFMFPSESRHARALIAVAALAIAVSGAIGFYHAGVEAHIFRGFTACTATAHSGSTDDILKQILKVPLVQCDQVQWRFIGLSLAAWNAIISLGGAVVIATLLRRGRST